MSCELVKPCANLMNQGCMGYIFLIKAVATARETAPQIFIKEGTPTGKNLAVTNGDL